MTAAAPRLAWFTPLQPVASGISRYNEELLPLLAAVWSIDVYVDGYKPTVLRPSERLRILPARAFVGEDRRARYDAVVYQMGNNPFHAYMYRAALERPGLLVLHDTVLHHLVLGMYARAGKMRDYARLLRVRYGAAGAAAAERVLHGQLPSELFDLPLSEDAVDAALLVAVHSQTSRDQVQALRPRARVERIPMGVPLPAHVDRATAREQLGLPANVFLVSSVTHVNPYKRLDVVMRAVRGLRARHDALLIVAGQVSEHMPLARLADLYGLSDAFASWGFVDDRMARLLVAASDACANLRYPTAGETSASLLRTMGAGRAVLVSDAGSFRELPDGTVAKVPVDVLEDGTVLALLEAFADDPSLKDALGANARSFVALEHSLAAMAAGYHRLLELIVGAPLPRPVVDAIEEQLALQDVAATAADPVYDAVGASLVELGLGGASRLISSAATAATELGIGVRTSAGGPEVIAARQQEKGDSGDERGRKSGADQ